MTPVDTGDDRTMLRVIPRLIGGSAFAYRGVDPVASVHREADGRWTLLLRIPRGAKLLAYNYAVEVTPRGPHRFDVGTAIWALVPLGATVWEVTPSIIIPGQLHAFVTLVDVPSVAPWEIPQQAPVPGGTP